MNRLVMIVIIAGFIPRLGDLTLQKYLPQNPSVAMETSTIQMAVNIRSLEAIAA